MGYIQEVMGPSLQVLTTKGSLLQSLSFTAELTNKVSLKCHKPVSLHCTVFPFVWQATNDDLILQSSLSLHHKLSSSSSSSPHTVVLLTDDRNLRVKAHAARLPVKDIPQFMTISRL